jgi:hypothetical protein
MPGCARRRGRPDPRSLGGCGQPAAGRVSVDRPGGRDGPGSGPVRKSGAGRRRRLADRVGSWRGPSVKRLIATRAGRRRGRLERSRPRPAEGRAPPRRGRIPGRGPFALSQRKRRHVGDLVPVLVGSGPAAAGGYRLRAPRNGRALRGDPTQRPLGGQRLCTSPGCRSHPVLACCRVLARAGGNAVAVHAWAWPGATAALTRVRRRLEPVALAIQAGPDATVGRPRRRPLLKRARSRP